ncbi:MAG: hypothetical protein HOI95_19510 [Chromatiales bacterium]|nr:hypothetical protein [Chromatiales bacterium]
MEPDIDGWFRFDFRCHPMHQSAIMALCGLALASLYLQLDLFQVLVNCAPRASLTSLGGSSSLLVLIIGQHPETGAFILGWTTVFVLAALSAGALKSACRFYAEVLGERLVRILAETTVGPATQSVRSTDVESDNVQEILRKIDNSREWLGLGVWNMTLYGGPP